MTIGAKRDFLQKAILWPQKQDCCQNRAVTDIDDNGKAARFESV
jgi:hypothetical protein